MSHPIHKKGHLLDVVFTNKYTSVSNTKVLNFNIGDHSLIRFDIQEFTEIIQPYKLVHLRDCRSINDNYLLRNLYEQFYLSDSLTTIGTAIDQYNNSIRSKIDKHASCLWLDQECLLLRRKRKKAERMFKKSNFLLTSLHITIYANNALI